MSIDKLKEQCEKKISSAVAATSGQIIYVNYAEYDFWINSILWKIRYFYDKVHILLELYKLFDKTPESALNGHVKFTYEYVIPDAPKQRTSLLEEISLIAAQRKELTSLRKGIKELRDKYFIAKKARIINKEAHIATMNQLKIAVYDLNTRHACVLNLLKEINKVQFCPVLQNSGIVATKLFR